MDHAKETRSIDGKMSHVADLFSMLRASMTQPCWSQPISMVFNQQYVPDVPCDPIIADFARHNNFEMHDLTQQLTKVITMSDLVKFYSTCSKLAVAKPKTLFFITAKVEIPNSMSVLEGLFALRASLIAGSFHIFLRDYKNANKKERKCMRCKVYNMCLWQSDNILLSSNSNAIEIKRRLEELISECGICLEQLTDEQHGTIVYPFRCAHAFHCVCVKKCTECPMCRNRWKADGVVFNLLIE